MNWLKDLAEKAKPRVVRALWFALALIFLFESWLWDNVKEWLRTLERVLGLERLEPALARLVARLSPQMTLALFAIPALAVLPFKMLALALLAHGNVVTGVGLILLVKTLTLGVTSFLFDLCRDKLLELQWFGRFYSIVLDVRAWATMLVKPYKARAMHTLNRLRASVASIAGKEGGDFGRRLARLRELARPKRSL